MTSPRERLIDELLARRNEAGYWPGSISGSPFAAAMALSALSIFLIHRRNLASPMERPFSDRFSDAISRGVHQLLDAQNEDGGWGDALGGRSRLAATLAAKSALILVGRIAVAVRDDATVPDERKSFFSGAYYPGSFDETLRRADGFLRSNGGFSALKKRRGLDQAFTLPVLTLAALAGLVSWREIAELPFELAILPHPFFRFLRFPIVRSAIPALVAVGLARFHQVPPKSPSLRFFRRRAIHSALKKLLAMQSESGGYFDSAPLTALVVMTLAASDQINHPAVRRGITFLLDALRTDGSWPITTDLALGNTALAIGALDSDQPREREALGEVSLANFLLEHQQKTRHSFTDATPGGWSWSDRMGGAPDSGNTAEALLALAKIAPLLPGSDRKKAYAEAKRGVVWLLRLRNLDGGWPTFCRGWGKLPFDRSDVARTAGAMRALLAWRGMPRADGCPALGNDLKKKIDWALLFGHHYLRRRQRPDGSWLPLWFGNENLPNEENPSFGTARALLGLYDLRAFFADKDAHPQVEEEDAMILSGVNWALCVQNNDGGWGRASVLNISDASSVEETAVVVEALLRLPKSLSPQVDAQKYADATRRGIAFLEKWVESGEFSRAALIGHFFDQWWYSEELYPMIFALSALTAGETPDSEP